MKKKLDWPSSGLSKPFRGLSKPFRGLDKPFRGLDKPLFSGLDKYLLWFGWFDRKNGAISNWSVL